MSKLEKVIKDLEAYRDRDFIREGITVFDSDPRYRKMIINNALALLKEDCHNCKLECLLQKYDELKEKYDALLKEQEAVVHPEPSCEMTYITDCCCDLCGVQLIREDIYCRCCGKRIEWEGR